MDLHGAELFETIKSVIKSREMEQDRRRFPEQDVIMREFARKLNHAQQVLECALEEYELYKHPRRLKETSGLGTAIDVAELVAYAHRVSYTTFAPPEYASGQVPLRGAMPPAPQEEQMRASQLYQAVDMDIGIPRPAVISMAPVETMESIKLKSDESPGSQRLPSGISFPAPPPGWHPGLPIELPAELPPIPPGWKPGDPIPLPPGFNIPPLPPGWKPGDVVVLPPSGKPQDQVIQKPALPAVPPPPPPPSGVIQVPFVQLDLNPELEEDYGSEYSDDDGSSDEDED